MTPARKPRTECCCHSVAAIIDGTVAPDDARSIVISRACLLSVWPAVIDDRTFDCFSDLRTLALGRAQYFCACRFGLGHWGPLSGQCGASRRTASKPLSATFAAGQDPGPGTGVNAVPLQSSTKASRFRATTLLFVVSGVRTSGSNPTLSASKSLILQRELWCWQFARHSRQLASPTPQIPN